jgi:2-oxoglutarate dehydrogenase E2 component (dihydrolipoamide succinyltransferase)
MPEIKVAPMPGAGTKPSIGRWFKSVGNPVTVQQPTVEIDTDNVTPEIRTPATGLLSRILVRHGGTVEPSNVLGIIDPV